MREFRAELVNLLEQVFMCLEVILSHKVEAMDCTPQEQKRPHICKETMALQSSPINGTTLFQDLL